MHTPTKQQWQTVIDNFKKVLPLSIREGCGLNMAETEVNKPIDFDWFTEKSTCTTCGTVHCVGGWYAVATLSPDLAEDRISYTDGAGKMAIDLGFYGMDKHAKIEALENWAVSNPHIWGNLKGSLMFSCETAYNGAETLAEVVTYLESVRDRSPE